MRAIMTGRFLRVKTCVRHEKHVKTCKNACLRPSLQSLHFDVHIGVAKPPIPAFLRGFGQPGRRITAFLRAFLGLHVEETRENAGKTPPGWT